MATPTADKIWHTTVGTIENPPLLLLHGLFCSHIEFTPLLPYLKDEFYVILVDLPGHSQSRSPRLDEFRLLQTAAAVARLIRQVSSTFRAHVAGMSFGSFIALELARCFQK